MNFARQTGLAGAIVLLTGALAHAQTENNVGISLRQWWPWASGFVRGGATGTGTDLHDDLGLSFQDSGITEIEMWGEFPDIPFRIYFSTYGGSFTQQMNLPRTILFEGQTIPAGTNVNSEFALRAYTLMLDFHVGKSGAYPYYAEFAVEVGAQYLAHDVTITTPTSQPVAYLYIPVPMLGFRASMTLEGAFEINGVLRGIATGDLFGGYNFSGLDLSLETLWLASRNFAVGVGWRSIWASGQTTGSRQDRIDYWIQGVFVTGTLMF